MEIKIHESLQSNLQSTAQVLGWSVEDVANMILDNVFDSGEPERVEIHESLYPIVKGIASALGVTNDRAVHYLLLAACGEDVPQFNKP